MAGYNMGYSVAAGILDGVLQAQLRRRQFRQEDQQMAMKERMLSLQERTQREAQDRLRRQAEEESSIRSHAMERAETEEAKQKIADPIIVGLQRDMANLQQKLQNAGVSTPQEVKDAQAKIDQMLISIRARGEEERKTLKTRAALGLGPSGSKPKEPLTPAEQATAQKKLASDLKGSDIVEGESLAGLEKQGHAGITTRMAALMTSDPNMTREKAKDMVKADDYYGWLKQDEAIGPEMKGRGKTPLFDPEQVNDLIAEYDPAKTQLFDEEGLFASYQDIVLGLTEEGWGYKQIQELLSKLIGFREERVYQSRLKAGTLPPQPPVMPSGFFAPPPGPLPRR